MYTECGICIGHYIKDQGFANDVLHILCHTYACTYDYLEHSPFHIEDIVEVLVSVRNRLSSVGSPSSSSSFAASTILSGKSLWGVTDESIQDDQNSPQHSLYMIGKESVNKKTFDDYNNLMKMNVRLLKTMCLKTLSEGLN